MMTRGLTSLLVLSVGFAIGHVIRWEVVDAQEGPRCAEENGDINGDRLMNIADPIALLQALFLGKRPPAPFCGGGGGGGPRFPDCIGMEGRFVDNVDGTVTDSCTGLVWQKVTADVNTDGIIDETDNVDWEAANAYAESLDFADANDWRLPTVEELFTLSDLARFQPSIDPSAFSAEPRFYWSATPHAEFADLKWGVVFFDGGICNDNVHEKPPVRAVRKP